MKNCKDNQNADVIKKVSKSQVIVISEWYYFIESRKIMKLLQSKSILWEMLTCWQIYVFSERNILAWDRITIYMYLLLL